MSKNILTIFLLCMILYGDFVFSQSAEKMKLIDIFRQDKSLNSFYQMRSNKEYGVAALPELSLNNKTGSGIKSLYPKFRKNPKSKYKPYESTKHFGMAVGELALAEFIPFSYSRWIKDWSKTPDEKNWTKLTFESEWYNIQNGFEYDTDNFLTNYFAHPFHGSLYFNTGRTNGYDFWESSVFSFTGSMIWEFFAETFRPSFNDWVNTSVNGINFGESLYRLSGMITDNNAVGSERVWREIGGAIINPVRGFNRLISGETYKVFPNPEYGRPDEFSLDLSAGLRTIRVDNSTPDSSSYDQQEQGIFSLNLKYGNAFKADKPFSHFDFSTSLTSGDPKLTSLYSSGFLYGWDLKKSKDTKHRMKFDLEYSYTNNPGFLYGQTAVIPNLLSSFKIGQETNLITKVGFNGILMGGTPNDYDTLKEGRTYDMGPGVGGRIGFEINKKGWSYLTAGYYGSYLFTMSEPSNSTHYLHFASLELKFPIKNYFAIGLEGAIYWRNSYYDFDPDVYKEVPVARILFYTLM